MQSLTCSLLPPAPCLAVLLLCGPVVLAQDNLPGLHDLDRTVHAGLAEWAIPGLIVTVVKDDRVVVAKGFGVRRLGAEDPVDADTLFGIGSVTKGMTAATLGLLVDAGRLGFDQPVVDHMPEFVLYDPHVTRSVTVRDLLSHRVGVGRMTGNRLRWLPHRPRSELVERIRHLAPEQPFRAGHVYSNVMYMVAGELVPRIAGVSYDDFLEERLFAPLGMARSTSRFATLARRSNVAEPHQEIEGEVVVIPRRNFDAIGPAGSVSSSAVEMAAWMRLLLGEPGVFAGTRLLEEQTVGELFRASSLTGDRGTGPVQAYGLGFGIGMHHGRRLLRHGGAVDGMHSALALIPELNLGVFVSANVHSPFVDVLAQWILDAATGVQDDGRAGRVRSQFQRRMAEVQRIRTRIEGERQLGTEPSMPLSAFVGRYDDPLYAEAEVRWEEGRLVLSLWDDPEQVADLEHWHHDTFRAIWRIRAMREEFVFFTRGADGGIDAMHAEFNLRPTLLQVGAYPSTYRRVVTWRRVLPGG